ncbi:hypothetical protein QBC35DRAFT_246600 [Podospora australis]|uniref:Uncharacterized protein n=1 Tax=Podospora australis TaxID=1536484 RepID=A0AAN6X1L7_9PEZI|nr:hypothetical protein QBC35DRAFT_246600 [Podospora australis]
MSQQPHPTLINLPQPPSNPDTPEIPGTPTSTTTSLSALSTTAIKDGHRGALNHRGHQHTLSANSLEAERADRISRLPGLGTVSSRGPPQYNVGGSSGSPQITPTSSQFPGGRAPPAVYFDAGGQPTAATKMSTVGTASATEESVSGRSRTTTLAGGGPEEDQDQDHDMLTEMDSASASGYVDAMDEDLASRSVGTFEADDRGNMSDDEDGNASLVGFGEGAGSTVSGPIYHRRNFPHQQTSNTSSGWGVNGLERSNSGLSETAMAPQTTGTSVSAARRDAAARLSEHERSDRPSSNSESNTPASESALREHREARMVDGVALNPGSVNLDVTSAGVVQASGNNDDDDIFVDTSTRDPLAVQTQHPTSAIRETQQPGSHQHVAQHQQAAQARAAQCQQQPPPQQNAASFSSVAGQQREQTSFLSSPTAGSVASSTGTGAASREAAERIIREQMDMGASAGGNAALGTPPAGGQQLGSFFFEQQQQQQQQQQQR